MSTAALKKKIKALVEKEQSLRKLELAYALFTEEEMVQGPLVPYGSATKQTSKTASVGSELKDTTAKSEREFAAGKGIPLEQFQQEMDAMLYEVFSAPPTDLKTTSITRPKRKRP